MRVLILCAANPALNPRPSRFIDFFKKKHQVSAMGINSSEINGVEVINYSAYKKRSLFGEIALYFRAFMGKYWHMIYTPNRLEIARFLKRRDFDLIICHDLVLLPIVLEFKKHAKVIFDAREFYPGWGKGLRWRLLFARFNDYLCRNFMPEADRVITVSKGVRYLYRKNYDIYSDVFYSYPKYVNLNPSIVSDNRVRVIYHGSATPMRHIEAMIEAIDFCDLRIEINLMLVWQDKKYFKKLFKMVKSRQSKGKKIRLLKPVPFEDLVSFCNDFDVGLYGLGQNTSNLKVAMPNKFFEYIQSRLALCVVPHIEMRDFIAKFQNGVIARSDTPEAIAESLNSFDKKKIMAMKIKSHSAARELSFEQNTNILQNVLKELFIHK
ncbi:MAG: glycosyltransferase [Helicobacter sp.]|mgnify:CR=1 FL=1|nr:glycosyltransferase [Helicobacter sp.]